VSQHAADAPAAGKQEMSTYNGLQTSPTDASEERISPLSGSDAENENDSADDTLENGSATKKRKRTLKIS
jgi:hypothetical protein